MKNIRQNIPKILKETRKKIIDLSYDESHDVLYITIADKSNSYGEEDNGTVVLKDWDSDSITGLIIMDYTKKVEKNK